MFKPVCHILATLICYFTISGMALAQTKVYVENHTDADLKVIDWSVGGDKVSKNAWKKGVESVAPGERKSILSLTRAGKLNWMDPTPRYVEPGKTVTFHTQIAAADTQAGNSVTLLQKLYGEGSTTKMWYAIDGINAPVDWELQDKEYTRQWVVADRAIKIVFKSYKEGDKTHVEYVFSYL